MKLLSGPLDWQCRRKLVNHLLCNIPRLWCSFNFHMMVMILYTDHHVDDTYALCTLQWICCDFRLQCLAQATKPVSDFVQAVHMHAMSLVLWPSTAYLLHRNQLPADGIRDMAYHALLKGETSEADRLEWVGFQLKHMTRHCASLA